MLKEPGPTVSRLFLAAAAWLTRAGPVLWREFIWLASKVPRVVRRCRLMRRRRSAHKEGQDRRGREAHRSTRRKCPIVALLMSTIPNHCAAFVDFARTFAGAQVTVLLSSAVNLKREFHNSVRHRTVSGTTSGIDGSDGAFP